MKSHSVARSSLAILSALIIMGACTSTPTETTPPSQTTPATTVPATTVPATTVPATTVPATTVPGTNVPVTPTPTVAPPTPIVTPPPLGPANLNLWVFNEGGIGIFIKQSVQDFEAAHPDIKINITAYPESNFGTKLDTAIAAGQAPDLAVVYGPDYMRRGLLLPLDDMFQQYGIDLSTYSQAIVGGAGDYACGWQGHLYCIGSYQGTVQMFYNKDMFAAAGIPDPAPWPPMTVDDFIADACKLTNKDAGIWGAAYTYDILPFAMGFSPDGRTVTGYMNVDPAVHNWGLLAQGLRDGCAPSQSLIDPWEQGRDAFDEGKVAMVVTDFQDLDTVDASGINWDTTAIPTPPGVQPYFPVWTDSTGIFATTQHPNEAEAFLAFLTTKGQQLQVLLNGNMPLDNAVARQMNWANNEPAREDGLEVASHGSIATPYIPNIYDALGAWYTDMDRVVGGELDIQAAMDDATPKVQQDLNNVWSAWDSAATPAP